MSSTLNEQPTAMVALGKVANDAAACMTVAPTITETFPSRQTTEQRPGIQRVRLHKMPPATFTDDPEEGPARQCRRIHRTIEQIEPRLRKVIRDLCSGKRRWPLFLHGPAGCGKTCAALALCDCVRDPRYLTVDGLVDVMMDPNRSDACEWRMLPDRGVAVLDELGTRTRDTDAHYSVIKRFADAREEANRVAVYISNLSPRDLAEQFDDRIADRLLCGTIFNLAGESRRMSS